MNKYKVKCARPWLGLLQSLVMLALVSLLFADEWKDKLAFAESQHEIILTLINEKRYDEVLPELRKICDLKLPDQHEDRLARSVQKISDALWHKGQDKLALEAADEGLRAVNAKRSKASLYKQKGYIFKKQGNDGKAREMFSKAQELESK